MGFVVYSQLSFGGGAQGDGSEVFSVSLSGADIVLTSDQQGGSVTLPGAALRRRVDRLRACVAEDPDLGAILEVVAEIDGETTAAPRVEYQPATTAGATPHPARYRLAGDLYTLVVDVGAFFELVKTTGSDGAPGALELLGFP